MSIFSKFFHHSKAKKSEVRKLNGKVQISPPVTGYDKHFDKTSYFINYTGVANENNPRLSAPYKPSNSN